MKTVILKKFIRNNLNVFNIDLQQKKMNTHSVTELCDLSLLNQTSLSLSINSKLELNIGHIIQSNNLTEYTSRICEELFLPSNTSSSESTTLNSSQLKLVLLKWVYPFLLLLGITGNLVTLFVMIRVHRRDTVFKKFSICLAALSVADLNVMLFGCAREYFEEFIGLEIRTSNTVSCKCLFFVCYLFSSFSAFLHAFIAMERWLAVQKPFKSKITLTSKLNKIFILILFLICFLFNLPFLWYTTITESLIVDRDTLIGANLIKDCQLVETSYELEIILIDTVFFSLFPFLITSVFSLLTLVRLIRTKAFNKKQEMNQKNLTNTNTLRINHSSACLYKRESTVNKNSLVNVKSYHHISNFKYTLMLISVPISYLITLFPINAIIFQGWLIKLNGVENLYENFGTAYSVGKILMYLNSSTNFIFYILLGNNLRKDFLAFMPFRHKKSDITSRRSTLYRLDLI